MIIKLYKYENKNNVANKLDTLSPVYTGDITPYGAFSSQQVVFKLDKMLDVNFCAFVYNKHDYYGFVKVDVDTNGVYVYNVTTDPLTTAWYNGCMNTNNISQFSSQGEKLKADDRLVYKDYIENLYYDIQTTSSEGFANSEWVVIMAVKRLGVSGSEYFSNPNFDLYKFSVADFNAFVSALYSYPESNQARFSGSIYNLFLIKKYELPNIFTLQRQVTLYAQLGDIDNDPTMLVAGDYTAYHAFSDTWFGNFSVKYDKNINYPINGIRQNAVFKLHIENAGDFNFKYRDVLKNQNLTSIGYEQSYNFVTGNKMVFLRINGETRKEFYMLVPIPMSCAVSYDSSIIRWDRVNSSVMGAGLNIIGQTVSAIATGGASLLTGMTSMLGSTINMQQTIMDAQFEQLFGARGAVGTVGGSPELQANYGSWLNIKCPVPIDAEGFQTLYGYPDGKIRNLNTIRGFCKTVNCKLLEKGIAADIISAAEKECDSGFYII